VTGDLEAGGFGDADPLDAWDPDDPLPELIRNLIRRAGGDRLFVDDLTHVLDRVVAELEDGA
jgi:hypothetical protein